MLIKKKKTRFLVGAVVCVVSVHSPHVCVCFLRVFCFPPTSRGVPVRICLVPVWVSAGMYMSVPCDGGTSCPGEAPAVCPELPAWASATLTLNWNKWVDK